jgi:hypothetical protein
VSDEIAIKGVPEESKCAACDAPENAYHQLGCPALVLELIQNELRRELKPVLEKLDELVSRKRKRGKAISEGKLKTGKVVPAHRKDLEAATKEIPTWVAEHEGRVSSSRHSGLPNRRDIGRAFQSKYDYGWLTTEAIGHCIKEGLIVSVSIKAATPGAASKEYLRAPKSEVETRYKKLFWKKQEIIKESGKDAVPDALLTELREAQAEYDELILAKV